MKIAYDHQVFSFQKTGGISRYFSNLLQYFNQTKNAEVDLFLKYSNNLYLKEIASELKIRPFLRSLDFKGKKMIIERANRIHSVKEINKAQYDIFHPTYYNTYYLKYVKKPTILTVHDMTHERFPKMFSKNNDFTLSYKEKAIKGAQHLIAISENTKKDVIEFYDVPESKISVIYHGIESAYNGQKVEGLPLKYFLFVGERGGYKNFDVVLRAMSKLQNRNCFLVCTGSPFSKSEIERMKKLDVLSQVRHCFVNDFQLNYLYENALALVYPSFYEGFGYPLLEAMRANCPVISANSSCLPEIGGSAARYFDPNSEDALCTLLNETIEQNSSLRRIWAQAGKLNFQRFGFEKSMKETESAYKLLANQ